jgi:peptide/nickel transport system substrate-binding protein
MLLSIPAKPVNAAIEIPTPREETFVFMGWTTFDSIQNPLLAPYANYMSLTQQEGEFLWYDNLATGERLYWQASGFEYSDDYTSMTIHIRQGVEWSDGEPFTAEDVKFTLDLIKENPLLANNGWANEWIDSVTTPDDMTVVITLTAPNPRADKKFSAAGWEGLMVVPKHIWENVENPSLADIWGRGENAVADVLTGPYQVYQISQEAGMVIFIRNENYWAKDVMGVFPEPKYYIHRQSQANDIEFQEIVSGGAYDGGFATWMPKDLLTTAIEVGENVTAIEYTDSGLFYLFVNCAEYPLSLPEVRWAISYAFERENFCASSPWYPGLEPAAYPWANWDSASQFEYDDIFNTYVLEYDLDRAAEILDNLGFVDVDADSIRETPNGTKLSWEIIVGYDSEAFLPMFLSLVSDFASIGVEITLTGQPWNVVTDRTSVGDFDLWWDSPHYSAGVVTSGEVLPLIEKYQSQYYTPIGTAMSEYDNTAAGRFTHPEIDSLVEQMQAIAPGSSDMDALSHQAVELFMEQLPAIPIAEYKRVDIFNSRYWTGFPTQENLYAYPSGSCPDYEFIINHLVSTGYVPATYTFVWITEAVEAFVGSDGQTYGPFTASQYAQVTEEDAASLVAAGKASYQIPSQVLTQILTSLSGLSSDISDVSDSLTQVSTTLATLNSQYTMLMMVVAVEAVGLVLMAVVILMQKKK